MPRRAQGPATMALPRSRPPLPHPPSPVSILFRHFTATLPPVALRRPHGRDVMVWGSHCRYERSQKTGALPFNPLAQTTPTHAHMYGVEPETRMEGALSTSAPDSVSDHAGSVQAWLVQIRGTVLRYCPVLFIPYRGT